MEKDYMESHIGIWKLKNVDGVEYFERDPELFKYWSNWADNHEIYIDDKGGNRIIFLGESVARGYFLDPFFNPCMVLDRLLNSVQHANYELIDLACTNQTLSELMILFKQSLKLKPEVVVFFAGNNWLNDLIHSLSNRDILSVAEIYDKHGMRRLKLFLERRLKKIVMNALEEFKAIALQNNIILLYIIPEYNLKDWNDKQFNVNLFQELEVDSFSWLSFIERITSDSSSMPPSELKAIGEKIIQFDPANILGYHFLGKSMEHLKNKAPSRKYFETARDSSIIFKSLGKPRVISIVQRAIQKFEIYENIRVINLPEIFKNNNNGSLPDRFLFFDYCHLTPYGIQIAVAYTAHAICSLLGKQVAPIERLKYLALRIAPNKSILARAHAFAAIHNAHFGQGSSIIEYHCRKAIEADPKIANFMIQYAKMATKKAPNIICQEFENIVQMMNVTQYTGGLNHKSGQKLMDISLVDVIVNAVDTNGSLKEEIQNIRVQEHSVNLNSPINILQSYYSREYDISNFREITSYYKSPENISKFYLIAEEGTKIKLHLVYRTPFFLPKTSLCALKINGTTIKLLEASKKWQTITLIIPHELIDSPSCVNILTIFWPCIDHKYINSEPKSLEALVNIVNPIFGEIHHFKATIS